MPATLPEVLHTYQNHLLDSTRWWQFIPRSDDIVISTSLKSGTTWTQAIVARLVPYWGNLHHTQTWWPYRTRDNVLFVHYNDLLRDLQGEIRRIARFLEITCTDQTIADVADGVTFAAIKQHAGQLLPFAEQVWKGGSTAFIFKGTNGRWQEVLAPEELALYTKMVAKVLEPACARWLEHGRAALT